MKELLDDMERALADLLLAGYTSGTSLSGRFRQLGDGCSRIGLIHGGQMMLQISEGLDGRSHFMEKDDLALTGLVCRAVSYIGLCRERIQSDDITARWGQQTGGTP